MDEIQPPKSLALGLLRTVPIDESTATQCIVSSVAPLLSILGATELFVWSRTDEAAISLGSETMTKVLRGTSVFRGQDPAVSHMLALQRSRGQVAPDGFIRLALGERKGPPASLELRINQGGLGLGEQALRDAFEALVLAWNADRAWLGPRAPASRRIGWLTYVRARVPAVTKPSKLEAVLGGSLLTAHDEPAGSEHPSALAGFEQVSLALDRASASARDDGTGRRTVPPATAHPPLMQLAPIEAKPLVPDAVASEVAPITPARVPVANTRAHGAGGAGENSDETLPFVALGPFAPATPFSGTTTPERLAQLKAAAPARQAADENQEVSETLLIKSPFAAHTDSGGALGARITPVAVPILSLDEYAKFRALLRARGEEHEPTWREFGVLSRAAKDALQARFAAHFQRDPRAQSEFVALVDKHVRQLARERVER